MSSESNRLSRGLVGVAALVAAAGVAVAAPGDLTIISVGTGGVLGDADADQGFPDVSPDGRWVTFASGASNLVPGNTLAVGTPQTYVRDRMTGTTTRVSVASNGAEPTGGTYANASTISADGRWIVFDTDFDFAGIADGDALSDVYLKDMVTGAVTRVSVGVGGAAPNHVGGSYLAWIDDSGTFVAYESDASNLVAGDSNGFRDAFRWNRTTGVTQLVSVTAGGLQGDDESTGVVISGNGRYVAYDGISTNHGSSNLNGDVYRKDMNTGALIIVSVSDAEAPNTGTQTLVRDVSFDGDTIAFLSNDEALTPDAGNGFRDVFVRKVSAGSTILCNKANDGSVGLGTTGSIGMSSDGNVVAFRSPATNLTPNDNNGFEDVFARNLSLGTIQNCSTAADGTQSDGVNNRICAVNGDGTLVVFYSTAFTLIPADTNNLGDFYAKELSWSTTPPGLCEYDINGDGNIDQGDVDCMISAVGGDPTCVRTDVAVDLDKNQDGNIDQGDVDIVVDVVGGGTAPGC